MEPKVDFSKFSKVQASLKERLMAKYDEKQQLADDELDMVAAACRGYSSLDDTNGTWHQRHKDRGIWR